MDDRIVRPEPKMKMRFDDQDFQRYIRPAEYDNLDAMSDPRLSLNDLAPATFNKFHADTRQKIVKEMKAAARRAIIIKHETAIRMKQEAQARHEEEVRRHKESLQRQKMRGQELEGVYRLTVNFDVASKLNTTDDQELAASLISLVSKSKEQPRSASKYHCHDEPENQPGDEPEDA